MNSIFLIKKALILSLMMSLPIVIVSVAIGLIVGFIQAVMQLQDQSLPFALKLIASVVVLALAGPWMSSQLIQYSDNLFSQLSSFGRM
ncbi:MAG: type III secretion system export apparatus subunit SctS [Burkholderiaceae bacterium]|jgi:type III secretion protein S